MSDTLWQPAITGLATLLGAGVGAFATYATQRALWYRQYAGRWDESRKNIYAQLLTTCNLWHNAIRTSDAELAASLKERFLELSGETSLLANARTRQAGTDLGNYLYELQEGILERLERVGADEGTNYLSYRDAFREAARDELRTSES